jgi:exopolyphosphatase/pppGpp-phosphohydrolase
MFTQFNEKYPRLGVIEICSARVSLLVMGFDALGKLIRIDSEGVAGADYLEGIRRCKDIGRCYLPEFYVISKLPQQEELASKIKELFDFDLRIIPSDEEARLIALGATLHMPDLAAGFAVDILDGMGYHEQILSHDHQNAWFNVQSLIRHLQVDLVQAQRVSDIALELYDQLHASAFVHPGKEGPDNLRKIMRASAWLHECGKLLQFGRRFPDADYLLINRQLVGFSPREQHLIALTVRTFTRELDATLEKDGEISKARYLAAILKIAAAAHASRHGRVKSITLDYHPEGISLLIKGRRLLAESLDILKINEDKETLAQLVGLPITCSIEQVSSTYELSQLLHRTSHS